MSDCNPKVFVSYSWEEENHKRWVKKLVDRLIEDGVNANFDQYDLTLGERLPQFMEQSISLADYVLVICTPAYKEKSDSRKGGVGYEGHIITGELLLQGNEKKYIPILRKGTISTAIPTFLTGKLYVDLSEHADIENNYQDLITTLWGKKKIRPSLGKTAMHSYATTTQSEQLLDEPIQIRGIITDQVTVPKMDGTRGSALYKIPFRLSKTPSSLWKKLFIQEWNAPSQFTTMHRPGIASVNEDEITLDGTTIEEVRDYHRKTLKLCVEAANKMEKEIIDAEQKKREMEENRRAQHCQNVTKIAKEIDFK